MTTHPRTPVRARRSWYFVEGGNDAALRSAPDSGADVLIQELEDFTPPARRPHARAVSPRVAEYLLDLSRQ
jgi:citrate lyase subunit beta/citryl-CoA lyase